MNTEDQNPADNLKRAQEQALKALGLPPSYPPTDAPKTSAVSYEEPAAQAYDHEIQNPPQPSLQLVAKNEDAKSAAKGAEQSDRAADVIEILSLLKEIESLPAEAQAQLAGQKSQLKMALTTGKIDKSAIDNIRADLQNAASGGGTAETLDAKVERLWGEFDKASAKVDKVLEKLPLTDEQKDQDKETKRELDEARKSGDSKAIKEALTKRIKFLSNTAEAHNSQELRDAIKELEERGVPVVAAVESKERQMLEANTQNSAPTIEKLKDNASAYPSENADRGQSGQLSVPPVPNKTDRTPSVGNSFE